MEGGGVNAQQGAGGSGRLQWPEIPGGLGGDHAPLAQHQVLDLRLKHHEMFGHTR